MLVIKPTFKIRPFTLVTHEGLIYLAVIQNGLQIGALARTPEGQYVQVNGAHVQPLNEERVLIALKREEQRERVAQKLQAAATVTVSVKRRRVPDPDARRLDESVT